MNLVLAVKLARARPIIIPRGMSSISRMAAVLESRNKIFIGYNSYRTHPFMRMLSGDDNKVSLHAEVSAIHKAILDFTSERGTRRSDLRGFDLTGFTLSIARVLWDGSQALAKPCPICCNAIQRFGIENVFYTE